MGPDPDRVAALEAQVLRLEARIARIEQARPATPVDPDPPAPGLEPPPAPIPAFAPAAATPVSLAAPPPPPTAARWAPADVRTPAAATPITGWSDGSSTHDATPNAGVSLRDLEERFASRALAIVGGLALVAAAIFFLSLAFSRGWVTEPTRVVIGIAAGSVALGGGVWRLSRQDRLLGTVLVGVGVGVLEVSLFAATSLYALLPPAIGLGGALVLAAVAAVVAIRFDARVVAGFGLVAALAAPPLVGAEPTLVTLAFLALVLVGTTAIALFRTWRWLPPLAFLLTAPQLAAWVAGDPETAPALVALVGFWLVNLVASAGEEVRIRRDDLRPSSAGLVAANAAFLLWGGLVVLSGPLEAWRGLFVLLAAVAHLGVGTWFLERQGWQHLFGTLVAGTGAALVAVAVLVQLDAPVVAGAWSAEAVALAWLAVRQRHRWSALAAATMLGLAMAQVASQYVLTTFDSGPRSIPDDELFALLAVLAATAAAGWLVALRWVRSVLVAAAVAIVAWAILFEADGGLVISLWAALLPPAVAADRLLTGLREDHELAAGWRLAIPEPRLAWPATIAGILLWAAAATNALTHQLDPRDWGVVTPPPVPLTDERALIAAALTATVILAGAIVESPILRRGAAIIAIAVLAVVAPFEVHADVVVIAWTALAVAAVGYLRWDRAADVPMTWLAGTLVAGAAMVAFGIVAPPSRLVIAQDIDPTPLLSLWPLSFSALAAVLLVASRHPPLARWGAWLQLAGGGVVVYGISVGVVAGFERLAGGSVPLDELATQAQVALSVTWTTIGVVALGAGLVMRRTLLRQGGLALLAIATGKVFLVDLAAMDVAYRALVLAGLGMLLLLGAWVMTRFRRPQPASPNPADEPEPAG